MSALIDQKRRDELNDVAALTVAERVALALRLGRRDLEIFCRAQGLTEAEALRRLRRQRQLGRRPSRCMSDERPAGTDR